MPRTNPTSATAVSCSNIALIKYWGNVNNALRIPANGSISMNLAGLETVSSVRFDPALQADTLTLNGKKQSSPAVDRVSAHLDRIRKLAHTRVYAAVSSTNNFPIGTGIASSASAFAALTAAACAALGLGLDERQLSAIARLGSGSASRSIPGGFVEWHAGIDHDSSFAESIAPPEHWPLVDLIAVVSEKHKAIGSTEGHGLAPTSPLQAGRLADTPRRLNACRRAVLARDFEALAHVIEHDTLIMHAVMMTSEPALMYWQPPTLAVIQSVRAWRAKGLGAAYTIDAGPNVHVLCESADRSKILSRLRQIDGVEKVLEATPGGPTRLVEIERSA